MASPAQADPRGSRSPANTIAAGRDSAREPARLPRSRPRAPPSRARDPPPRPAARPRAGGGVRAVSRSRGRCRSAGCRDLDQSQTDPGRQPLDIGAASARMSGSRRRSSSSRRIGCVSSHVTAAAIVEAGSAASTIRDVVAPLPQRWPSRVDGAAGPMACSSPAVDDDRARQLASQRARAVGREPDRLRKRERRARNDRRSQHQQPHVGKPIATDGRRHGGRQETKVGERQPPRRAAPSRCAAIGPATARSPSQRPGVEENHDCADRRSRYERSARSGGASVLRKK